MATDPSAPFDVRERSHPDDAAAPHERADRSLVERVVAGDRDGGRELAQRLLPFAHRICSALVHDPIDADDATHIALLEVLRSAASFRGDATIEGWARRIVVRSTMRFLAGRRQLRAREDGDARVSQLRAPSMGGQVLDELPRPLAAYLDELPESQREAIVLRHAIGCSLEELAELTGVSPNTAKARLLHGRRTLRRLIRRDINLGRGPTEAS